jgi:hypothetical protein
MLANDMQITVRYGGICIRFGHLSGTISSDSEPFFFGKRLISVNVYIYPLSFQRDRVHPTGNSVRDHIGNSFGNLEAFLSIKPSISATSGATATIKSSNY